MSKAKSKEEKKFRPVIKNLASDLAGLAKNTSADLVNTWGLVTKDGVYYVVDNGTNLVSPLTRRGSPAPGLPVSIFVPPGRGSLLPPVPVPSAPTGIVLNNDKAAFKGATFIVVGEGGTISSWSPEDGKEAKQRVDNSRKGAIYKGVTIASSVVGSKKVSLLYVANFNSGLVEVYDSDFAPVLPFFTDPALLNTLTGPPQFAPFNVSTIPSGTGGTGSGGKDQVVVTFALQDADKHDNESGAGLGFIDTFSTGGHFLKRVATGGVLDAPWGLTLKNQKLFVGNFGDGRINIFDLDTGEVTAVRGDNGTPLAINGLWGLLLVCNQLFFAAGINDEAHGLFGKIRFTL